MFSVFRFGSMLLVALILCTTIGAANADGLAPEQRLQGVLSLSRQNAWHFERDRDADDCWLAYRGSRRSTLSPIRICLKSGVPMTLIDDFGFFKEEGIWKGAGAFGLHDASVTRKGDNIVLRSRVECGLIDRGAQHAAGGQCEKAVVVGESVAVTVETDGRTFSLPDFDDLLAAIHVDGHAPAALLDDSPTDRMKP